MKLRLFKRKQADDEQIEAEIAVAEVVPEPPIQHQTGIVKAKPKQFILDEPRHGGRIVKTMPANLRHMKELADKTDD